jgi:CHAT domain-containing protein/Tfp pilus assembly protein PilF
MKPKISVPCSILFYFLWSFAGFSQSTNANSASEIIDSVLQEVDLQIDKRKLQSADSLNESAARLIESGPGMTSSQYARYFFNRGRIYYYQNQNPEAERFYVNARNILDDSTSSNYQDLQEVLNTLGLFYRATGQYKKSVEAFIRRSEVVEQMTGKESKQFALSLNDIALLYKDIGNYKKSEDYNQKALFIQEKLFGPDHSNVANSLNNLGVLNRHLGKYEISTQYLQRALDIRQKKNGRYNLVYSITLINLANTFKESGQYDIAKDSLEEVCAIRLHLYGNEHNYYASSLNLLAELYKEMNQFDKAKEYFEQALSIRQVDNNKKNALYASSLLYLASVYKELGEYHTALSKYKEAIGVQEFLSDTLRHTFTKSLTETANLYTELGEFSMAESILRRALRLVEKNLGAHHIQFSNVLVELADLNAKIANPMRAIEGYNEALSIREGALGKEHTEYAQILIKRGDLYVANGDLEKAKLSFSEAAEIQRNILGILHPDFANSLAKLAMIFRLEGNYTTSDSFYLEAKGISQMALGKNNGVYIRILMGQAELSSDRKNFKEAGRYCKEAIKLSQQVFGRTHPQYAMYLKTYADIHVKMYSMKFADSLYKKATQIFKSALGTDHNLYMDCLNTRIKFYEGLNRRSKSEALLTELSGIVQNKLRAAATYLSSQELSNYTNQFQVYIDDFGSLVLNRMKKNKSLGQLPSIGMNFTLFYKGFLLNSACRLNAILSSAQGVDTLIARLKDSRRILAIELSKINRDEKRIKALRSTSDEMEKMLISNLKSYATELKQISWKEVQDSLDEKEAALEFIHFKVSQPGSMDKIIYMALVLKTEFKQPKLIYLCEENSLNVLLKTKGERRSDYVNTLYSLKDRGASVIQEPQPGLVDLIYTPLKSELQNCNKMYCAASGLLHRINLSAIAVDSLYTWGDKHQLVNLVSTRHLVHSNSRNFGKEDAALFGGIKYELSDTLRNLQQHSGLITGIDELQTQQGSVTSIWNYLSGTYLEVMNIDKLMKEAGIKTDLRISSDATEESFKKMGADQASSPRNILIATHGYFFPDPSSKDTTQSQMTNQKSVFSVSAHPMMRSGLLMAGANFGWEGKNYIEGMDDGILTAFEISQLDLSGTELAVLSACETGLGDIKGFEGVFGLQRAFKIAGVKNIIMSLWQVPDKQTSILMQNFYKKWLNEKMTIPDAFRSAQKQMREFGFDPYQWAGFILLE